ncbi:multiheme c-type cytochrome [Deferrisoma camini]|uniref:multiheme c-type cytochrome n=1 Tax=Deferrisoma camini TaxID=1035120 RepID=UPI00046CF968|nr:cytochrome c family protein [Deferrisoma camini]
MRRAAVWAIWAILAGALAAGAADRVDSGPVFRYLGAKWCKPCHNRNSPNPKLRVFHGWEGSAHAKAWEVLPDEDKDNPVCLRCHTTGYGLPRRADTRPEDLRGVQCEACHGPGSHYFPWRIMKDPVVSRERGLVIPDRDVCMRCHW